MTPRVRKTRACLHKLVDPLLQVSQVFALTGTPLSTLKMETLLRALLERLSSRPYRDIDLDLLSASRMG